MEWPIITSLIYSAVVIGLITAAYVLCTSQNLRLVLDAWILFLTWTYYVRHQGFKAIYKALNGSGSLGNNVTFNDVLIAHEEYLKPHLSEIDRRKDETKIWIKEKNINNLSKELNNILESNGALSQFSSKFLSLSDSEKNSCLSHIDRKEEKLLNMTSHGDADIDLFFGYIRDMEAIKIQLRQPNISATIKAQQSNQYDNKKDLKKKMEGKINDTEITKRHKHKIASQMLENASSNEDEQEPRSNVNSDDLLQYSNVHILCNAKEARLSRDSKDLIKKYLNGTEIQRKELFFGSADKILLNFAVDTEHGGNTLQGVGGIIEKLLQIKADIKDITNFIPFLAGQTDYPYEPLMQFVCKVGRLDCVDYSLPKRDLLSIDLGGDCQDYLAIVKENTKNNLIFDAGGLYTLRDFINWYPENERTLENFRNFVSQAVLLIKNGTEDRTRIANKVVFISGDYENCVLCEDVGENKFLVQRYFNIFREAEYTTYNIVSAMETHCIDLIVRVYTDLRAELPNKRLSWSLRTLIKQIKIFLKKKDTTEALRLFIMRTSKVGFDNIDEAVHHLAKHPQMEVYPNFKPRDLVKTFYQAASEWITTSENVHFEVTQKGSKLYFYSHNWFEHDVNGFLWLPTDNRKTKDQCDRNRNPLQLVLLIDENCNVYIKTLYDIKYPYA